MADPQHGALGALDRTVERAVKAVEEYRGAPDASPAAPASPTLTAQPFNLAQYITDHPYQSSLGALGLGGLTYAALGGNEGVSRKIQAMIDNPLATASGLGAAGVLSKITYDALNKEASAKDDKSKRNAILGGGLGVIAGTGLGGMRGGSPNRMLAGLLAGGALGVGLGYLSGKPEEVPPQPHELVGPPRHLAPPPKETGRLGAALGGIGGATLGAAVPAVLMRGVPGRGLAAGIAGLATAGIGSALGSTYKSSYDPFSWVKGVSDKLEARDAAETEALMSLDPNPTSAAKALFGAEGKLERKSKQENNALASADNFIDDYGNYLLGGAALAGTGYGGYKLYKHLTGGQEKKASWGVTLGQLVEPRRHLYRLYDNIGVSILERPRSTESYPGLAGTLAGTALGTYLGDKNLRSAGISGLGALAGGHLGYFLGAGGLAAMDASGIPYNDSVGSGILLGSNLLGQLGGGAAAGYSSREKVSNDLSDFNEAVLGSNLGKDIVSSPMDPYAYVGPVGTLAGTALGAYLGDRNLRSAGISGLGALAGGQLGANLGLAGLEGLRALHKDPTAAFDDKTYLNALNTANLLGQLGGGAAAGKYFSKKASGHESKYTAEYNHHSALKGKQKTELPDFLQKEIIDAKTASPNVVQRKDAFGTRREYNLDTEEGIRDYTAAREKDNTLAKAQLAVAGALLGGAGGATRGGVRGAILGALGGGGGGYLLGKGLIGLNNKFDDMYQGIDRDRYAKTASGHESKYTAEYNHHSALKGKQKTELPDFLQKEIIEAKTANFGKDMMDAYAARERESYLKNLSKGGLIGAGMGTVGGLIAHKFLKDPALAKAVMGVSVLGGLSGSALGTYVNNDHIDVARKGGLSRRAYEANYDALYGNAEDSLKKILREELEDVRSKSASFNTQAMADAGRASMRYGSPVAGQASMVYSSFKNMFGGKPRTTAKPAKPNNPQESYYNRYRK